MSWWGGGEEGDDVKIVPCIPLLVGFVVVGEKTGATLKSNSDLTLRKSNHLVNRCKYYDHIVFLGGEG